MNRNKKYHLIFILSVNLFFSFKIANGLDLTIDLPLSEGKAPVLFYESVKKEKLAPQIPQKLSTPVLPTGSIPAAPKIFPAASQITQNNNFPELSCLKDNIRFWETVYSEIDVDEGIVHDRNNLGRIYNVVSLPSGVRAREVFLRNEKKLVAAQLVNLAKKIRSHEPLTSREKSQVKVFSKSELNYNTIMEAASNIRVQTGLKSQFISGVQRSLSYMSVIFPIVKQSGLPADLAYLPHVESSYNSHAGSKVGALGLWQLMPSTMRTLGGKDAVYKRTDPRVSTIAAMKLLKMNYEKTGNWPLALTAYNYGTNGIVRAINETNSRDLCQIIDHYQSRSFKFASSNFYAQFLAAKKVAMKKYKSIVGNQKNSIVTQNLLTATGGALP